jgi:hypothetical protein
MTPRELAAMRSAWTERERRAWGHTASLMALTAEINRDKKQRPEPFTASDFMPLFGLLKEKPREMSPMETDLMLKFAAASHGVEVDCLPAWARTSTPEIEAMKHAR